MKKYLLIFLFSIWILFALACGFANASPKTSAINIEWQTPVCISPYIKYNYEVCNNIFFTIEGNVYSIPKGFHTDLASIPRPFWFILSPAHSSLMKAAIVHDWFYRMTCDFNRKQTDLIFYALLRQNNVNIVTANLMYYSVRLFGGKYYNESYCEKDGANMWTIFEEK